MVVTFSSGLLGFAIGMLIAMLREKTRVINYAIRNSMNTMPELLRDLYPDTYWEPSKIRNHDKKGK